MKGLEFVINLFESVCLHELLKQPLGKFTMVYY